MKIQLDTENKTIKLESNVKLSKLVETLNKLLPNNEWKGFTLETNTTITSWHDHIIIRDRYREPYWQPWYAGHTTVGTRSMSLKGAFDNNSMLVKNDDLQLKAGVFNIEA